MNTPDYQTFLNQYHDTRIFFGDDPGPALVDTLLARRARKIALFTGHNSADASGNYQRFVDCTAPANVEIVRFNDIPVEPTVGAVTRMIRFLRDNRPDTVVALGGGSVMDAAKAANLCYRAGGDVSDFFGSDVYSARHPNDNLDRILAIPTTSGTGSEVTPYANIVDMELHVKKLISDPVLIPSHAFVSPLFSASMPVGVSRATGCDALSHLLEGFLNVRQDHRCEAANDWALEGIRLVVENLPAAIKGDSMEARRAMAAAATLGGMVIRYKSTGLPHLCSFSWFGLLEHGLAVALVLPAAWLYYMDNLDVATRTMKLKAIFPGETPDEVVDSFRRFLRRCGVPASIKSIPGLTPEVLERTARSAEENPMKLQLSPRPVPPGDAYRLISRILANS